MLKFQYAINLGLATLLVVPAVTLGASQNESLENALTRTLSALEQLARVEQRLQERDPSAIHDALLSTEAPLPVPESNPGARDELLVALRTDVARLQREIDTAQGNTRPGDTQAPLLPEEPIEEPDANAGVTPTVGLDDAMRRRLAVHSRPTTALPQQPVTTTGEKRTFENESYAADPYKLGRAYYRQGRYDLALTAFESDASGQESRYWKARSLEKLGRNNEAIAAYGRVIADEKAGALADRAKEDLDFLQWRLGFDRKPKASGGSKP